MRARLSWRLLVVPRLLLAFGVMIWALLNVVLARKPRQPPRAPPSSADPVAGALADARPVSRFAGEELDVDDLRWIVSVQELEVDRVGGYNTVVGLDDVVSSYADVAADGIEDALADEPGIDAVAHPDREFLLVRSALSLPDVHAAAIRALLAVNRNPRPVPRLRALEPAVVNALADSVATVMAGYGFNGRLGADPGRAGSPDRPVSTPGPGFYRLFAADRLVHVVRLRDGIGHHNDDGSITDARVRITVEVVEIPTADAAGCVERDRGYDVIAGERIVSVSREWTPATVDGIERELAGWVLPLCGSTTSRAAIVDRWVRGLPGYVPDRTSWEAADVAARWGFRKHARDLLRYGGRGRPGSAAVAAKHGL